jgi:hypothetical protein
LSSPSEEEIQRYREKFVSELISFGFTMAVVVALTLIQQPDIWERFKMRCRLVFQPEKHDPLDAEVNRFAQEISNWEHEEQER